MIYAKVFETKLTCDYCDHNKNKQNNYNPTIITKNQYNQMSLNRIRKLNESINSGFRFD